MSSKVWFVTGASRGLGRRFTEAALERGDRVAATARRPESLADLAERYGDAVLPLALDVTDRAGAERAVAAAHDRFGRLDVIVNNAGYGLFGTVEEIGEQQLRDQLETNFFGALHVTRAALPLLRAQGSGHIVQISTIGGVLAFPTLGAYHASKWALEGMSEALAAEVAPFGIKVTIVEPGGFATDWAGSSAVRGEARPEYEGVHTAVAATFAEHGAATTGDPVAAGQALLRVVDAPEPPLRVLFGDGNLKFVEAAYQQRLATWQRWEDISIAASGS